MDRVIQGAHALPGSARLLGLGVSNLIAAACLLAWAMLLGTSLLDVSSRLLGGGVLRAALQGLHYAPLGLLGVLAMPDRDGRLARGFRVALPATVVAIVLAHLALAARAGWTAPGPFELVLPCLAILLGIWAGLAWRRGWWSRLVFLPKLVALGLLLILAGLALALLTLEQEPALPEPRPMTSADKRHLVSLFQDKDPRKVPPGETRTVRLSAQELDQLVAWAAAVGLRARTTVSLRPGGVSGVATVHVPRTGRWLNVTASTLASIDNGRLSLSGPRLQVGRLTVPPLLLDAITPFLAAGLQGDRDLRRVLPAVASLSLEPGEAALTYGRAEMPRGLIARLVWGEEASEVMREAVYAQLDRLLGVLSAAPSGDARFGAALETAFALARERSARGSAVEENRAALLALGVVLGHQRLAAGGGREAGRQAFRARRSGARGHDACADAPTGRATSR